MLGKLAALSVMHRAVPASTPLFQRLLAGMAAIIAFSLIASLLAGALIIGTAFFAYNQLILNGLEPNGALLCVGAFLFMLLIALVLGAMACVKKLRDIPHRIMNLESPLAHRAGGILNAFIDGVLTHPRRH